MGNFTSSIITYFVRETEEASAPQSRKSRVLVYAIFLGLIGCLLSFALSILQDHNADVPILLGVAFLIAILFVYRATQNVNLAGNLFAGGWFLVLAPSVISTGGLFSDNLLWTILVPLISIFFGQKKWGYAWFLILVALIFYLGLVNTEYNQGIHARSDTAYYVTSYSLLFAFVFGLTLIFETGQRQLVKIYRRQRREISKRGADLKRKNEHLQQAKAELEESNAMLTQFAHAASHDLKEPLRMIGMYTGLIQRQLKRPGPTENVDEYMGYVTDGVQRMEQMLTDLLDYSRVGNHDHLITSVDLNDTLFMVVTNLTVPLKETGGSVFTPELPVIQAPASLIGQLFQNIIANGIKFRHPQRPPEIHLRWEEREEFIQLTIQDNGIGIEKKDQSRVFNIFERLHTRSEYPGSGIGLATCHRIVKNLGGKIWVTSQPGLGTSFHFTLPRTFTSPLVREPKTRTKKTAKTNADRDARSETMLPA